MDLIIKTKSNVYIIENKIKSLPRMEQLEGYEKSIRKRKQFSPPKRTPYYCLTGISEYEPEFLEKPWTYVNYRAISERIKEVTMTISLNEETKHFRTFALEYSEMIRNLCDLLDSKEKKLEKEFYFPQYHKKDDDLIAMQKELRIDDILQKNNADRFTIYCGKQLEAANICGFKNVTAYTRQRSLSEFYFMVGKKDEKENKTEYLKIGVQIQNTMFRWFAETNKAGMDAKTVFDSGEETDIRWFTKKTDDGYITLPIGTGKKKTGMKNESCFFKPMFVYQYFTINPKECSSETLAETVVSFMKKAETIKDVYANKLAEIRRKNTHRF